MRFFVILLGLVVLSILVIIIHSWWRDEQGKLEKSWYANAEANRRASISAAPSPATPLHPSIDPYLTELRAHLLTPPLPQGPGEMAERVYAHLMQWLNDATTNDAAHNVDLESELLVEPTSRYVDM